MKAARQARQLCNAAVVRERVVVVLDGSVQRPLAPLQPSRRVVGVED